MTTTLNPSTLKGDIFGGITAGIVALPLALAFGVVSGLGAEAGLYGAIILGFVAALFGGTPTQVSGPTGPMTVISAVVIADAIQSLGGLEAGLGLILMTFILAGLFQACFGLLRLGQIIRYIPQPVISGFMSGIGAIIILLQIFPMIGAKSPSNVIHVMSQFHTVLPQINWYSLALTGGTIGIIYGLPKITRLIPSQLVALLLMSGIAMYWQLPVPTIGNIPAGLPKMQFGALSELNILGNLHLLIIPALTLAALGTIDSLLTSVVADNLTKTRHNSNQELIGQGFGNALAGFFGGLPGAGATMRTVVNINNGGQTRLSGMIHSLLLLTIVLGAHNLASDIPLAVLAGILITVGVGIIDYKGIRNMRHIPLSDSAVMLLVLGMTVFVDLLQAVAAGFVLASVLFMKKMGELNDEKTTGSTLKNFNDEQPWPDERKITQELGEQVFIKHLYGPLFFGFSSQFTQRILELPKVKIVIIRLCEVPYIDQSGLYALEDAILTLAERGVEVYLTGIQEQPLARLERLNIIPGLLDHDHVFAQYNDCLQAVLTRASSQNIES